VVLGGDVHEHWVGHVKADYADAASTTVGVEFCGTSISSRASDSGMARAAERLAENPHFVYGEARYRGYGLAEFTPQRLTTTLRAVQDATRADSEAFTLAQFGVAAGRAQIERQ
jgi:alkaline phosphatase D